ncbi:MAG TPA: hypothetical protein VNW25_06845, partial [Candidatus Sulfotelmatobacter sp.]|nr:hypothetical protein [Candidatus Sulfotelmatobacter sp.]
TLASRGSTQPTLSIGTSSCVVAGNYPLNVTASDGTNSHSIQLTITVTDFTINTPASILTIQAGSNSSLTLSFQGLNSFQGTLLLSAITSPSGPIATLNPSSVVLTANSNSSLLTITVPSNTPQGSYQVTIQAASGTLLHTVSITVTVPSGSVGGLLLQIDRLGLVSRFFPASALALVGFVAVSVAVERSRLGSKTPRTGRRVVTRRATFPSSRPWVLRSYPVALGTIRADDPR